MNENVKELWKIIKSVLPHSIFYGFIAGVITSFGWCFMIVMEYYGAEGKRFSDLKMLSSVTIGITMSFILIIFLICLAIVLMYNVQRCFWDSVHEEKVKGTNQIVVMLPDISVIAKFITSGKVSSE